MSDAPRISVIMPCYEQGATLAEAIDSVVAQRGAPSWELLLVDDGSRDPLTRRALRGPFDPRVQLVTFPENRGLSAARNAGLARARGEYVTALDSDDRFGPDWLARAVEALERDPELTFVSHWLQAFGDETWTWRPQRCDAPALLDACWLSIGTVVRREALQAVGGWDEAFSAGLEDWDLWLRILACGARGAILPAVHFHYRRHAATWTSRADYPVHYRRLVRRHAERFSASLPEVLAGREARFAVRLTRLLGLAAAAPPAEEEGPAPLDPAGPRGDYAVLLPCPASPASLARALWGLRRQTLAPAEVLLLDSHQRSWPAGVASWGAAEGLGLRLVSLPDAGRPELLRAGAVACQAQRLLVLEPSWELTSGAAAALLELGGDLALGGLRWELPGGWAPPPLAEPTPTALLAQPLGLGPLLVSRRAWEALGGAAPGLGTCWDVDLALRALAAGQAVRALPGPAARARPDRDPEQALAARPARRLPAWSALQARHGELIASRWEEALVAREAALHSLTVALGRAEVAAYRDRSAAEQERLRREDPAPPSPLRDWRALRRAGPLDPAWGFGRGSPVDRPLLERFLGEHADDLRGPTLEVQEDDLSRRLGAAVVDVLDLNPANPRATVLADLRQASALGRERWDCLVLTQTLHLVDALPAALEACWRALRPGGVLLATLPTTSRVALDYGPDVDCWRFTPLGARAVFERCFAPQDVTVLPLGNLLQGVAFLAGLAAEELTALERSWTDPDRPLLLGVRAQKPGPFTPPPPPPRILVWRDAALEAGPDDLAAQLDLLTGAVVAPLLDVLSGAAPGALALTCDDPSGPALATLAELLAARGLSATAFLPTPPPGGPAWGRWRDALRARLAREAALPADVALEGLPGPLPLETPEERGAACAALQALLGRRPPAERAELWAGLSAQLGPWPVTPPAPGPAQVAAWAGRPGLAVGSLGLHACPLPALEPEERLLEALESRLALERLAGAVPAAFAHPEGWLDPLSREAVAAAGYRVAVTLDPPPWGHSDPLAAPRVPVGPGTAGLKAALARLGLQV